MNPEELTATFDQQASSYDHQWSKLSQLNGALHLLTNAVFAQLPATARILCVGAGTGAEILALAAVHPEWEFTAVEPSGAMLEVFRTRAEEVGISARCTFHHGYLDTLPNDGPFHAATAFLVSHFITERQKRVAFFAGIADRLPSGGILVSSDLTGNLTTPDGNDLLNVWLQSIQSNGMPPEKVEKMREVYAKDVAILPRDEVHRLLLDAGFASAVPFFQAALIQAWYARKG